MPSGRCYKFKKPEKKAGGKRSSPINPEELGLPSSNSDNAQTARSKCRSLPQGQSVWLSEASSDASGSIGSKAVSREVSAATLRQMVAQTEEKQPLTTCSYNSDAGALISIALPRHQAISP